MPIASKEAKASKGGEVQAIFKTYSLGVSTNRDSVVYDYDLEKLNTRVSGFLGAYNSEVLRWVNSGQPKEIDAFLNYSEIKWSRNLKAELKRKHKASFYKEAIKPALYRPFNKEWLYCGSIAVDEAGLTGSFLPYQVKADNMLLCLTSMGNTKPFHCLMTDCIPDLHLTGDSQCFPLYTYALDGKLRRDNITDWALAQFQAKYGTDVTKQDIFHYVYGLLHSPEYRERYKENLKRELPRIPLVEPNPAQAASPFRVFADAGAALAALHVGYDSADEYPLKQLVNKDVPFTWRVAKMRLNKEKTAVVVNEALTLAGIPPETLEYKLGNRSALEWVLDQYQVSTDKRSGIVTDPNRAGDPEYITRLIGRVVTVSVETARIVAGLPGLGAASAGETRMPGD